MSLYWLDSSQLRFEFRKLTAKADFKPYVDGYSVKDAFVAAGGNRHAGNNTKDKVSKVYPDDTSRKPSRNSSGVSVEEVVLDVVDNDTKGRKALRKGSKFRKEYPKQENHVAGNGTFSAMSM